MPIGLELKDIIFQAFQLTPYNGPELTNKDHVVGGAIELYSNEKKSQGKHDESPFDAIKTICKALPLANSIDTLIHSYRDNWDIAICGKIGITYSIIESERKSKLFTSKNKDVPIKEIENTWYGILFKKLNSGLSIEEFIQRMQNITFITFNYDRSLEYFLYHAIMNYYRKDERQTTQIVNSLNIFHPYGQAGRLPFQGSDNCINFGGYLNADSLYALSVQIKTFMEGVDKDSENYKNVISSLINANRIIYLGFAYYEQNMDLLYPSSIIHEKKKKGKKYDSEFVTCYGTNFGFSDNEKHNLMQRIQEKDLRINNIDLFNGTCYNFFNEFSERISF
jgi:hypothetical protein